MSETERPEEPKDPQELPNSRGHSENDTGFGERDRLLAVIAFCLGITALLATLVALNFRSLILWIVLTIVFGIASAPLITAIRKWKYITHAYALLCAILAVILYVNIAFRDTASVKAKSVTDASVTRPIIKIESPPANSLVDRCINVSGEANIPTSDAIWIFVQGADPKIYYPEGDAKTSPSPVHPGWVDWNFYPTQIGSLGSSGTYDIYAVVVDSSTSDFMAKLEYAVPGKNGITYYKNDIGTQADLNLPPEAAYDSRIVQRIPNAVGNCG